MSKVIIFAAPSGSGKTTLVKHLLQKNKDLAFSISATTRDKRAHEVDGLDYHFLSLEDFKQKIANDEFIEYEEVYPNKFYGTLKSEVQRIWNEGKNAIFDLDVQGGITLKKIYQEKALSIFVKIPSIEVLTERLKNRQTETTESLAKRIAKARSEMLFEKEFDISLLNEDLATSCNEAQILYNNFTL